MSSTHPPPAAKRPMRAVARRRPGLGSSDSKPAEMHEAAQKTWKRRPCLPLATLFLDARGSFRLAGLPLTQRGSCSLAPCSHAGRSSKRHPKHGDGKATLSTGSGPSTMPAPHRIASRGPGWPLTNPKSLGIKLSFNFFWNGHGKITEALVADECQQQPLLSSFAGKVLAWPQDRLRQPLSNTRSRNEQPISYPWSPGNIGYLLIYQAFYLRQPF